MIYLALGKWLWDEGGAIMASADAGATWSTLLDPSVSKVRAEGRRGVARPPPSQNGYRW
jgi:hypothetical protein